jgi:hypothetical protein
VSGEEQDRSSPLGSLDGATGSAESATGWDAMAAKVPGRRTKNVTGEIQLLWFCRSSFTIFNIMPALRPPPPMASTSKSADALEDDFEIDGAFSALSPAAEELSASGDERVAAQDSDDQDHVQRATSSKNGEPASKKRKKKEMQKEAKVRLSSERKISISNFDENREIYQSQRRKNSLAGLGDDDGSFQADSIGRQPPSLQADRLTEKQLKAMPGLSAIELDDIRISEPFIFDASEIEDRRDMAVFIGKGREEFPVVAVKTAS